MRTAARAALRTQLRVAGLCRVRVREHARVPVCAAPRLERRLYATAREPTAEELLSDAALAAAFAQLDVDGDGVLQIDELRPLAEALFKFMPPIMHHVGVELLLRHADGDGLSNAAVLRVGAVARGHIASPQTEQLLLLQTAWALYEPTPDSKISAEDAVHCCTLLWGVAGQPSPPAQLVFSEGAVSWRDVVRKLEEHGERLPSFAAAEARLRRGDQWGRYVGFALAFGAYWYISSSGLLNKVLSTNPLVHSDN
eukprot:TRINITY_DN40212_c0_g1_i1.p1 TRINITY_DN40212_c0_g1~~TRINITY_DN40212_c0_g1_i1.p1  ORF type:complete len:254 (+),score=49.48 TRINITY_DN40212_c0_g1_i1:70-831(+)